MGNYVVALYAEVETWGYPKTDIQQNEQVSLEDHPHLAFTPTAPNDVFKCCSLEICWRKSHSLENVAKLPGIRSTWMNLIENC